MRKFFYLAMASVAAIFAGCSNDEDALQTTDSLKDKPINVDVLVSDIKTRAGYDTDNLPTKFYLTIDQDGTEHDYTNVVMKYEDDKWVAYESDAAGVNKIEMHWAGSEGNECLTNWLTNAGTNVSNRTLILANRDVINTIHKNDPNNNSNYLPGSWIVRYKNY